MHKHVNEGRGAIYAEGEVDHLLNSQTFGLKVSLSDLIEEVVEKYDINSPRNTQRLENMPSSETTELIAAAKHLDFAGGKSSLVINLTYLMSGSTHTKNGAGPFSQIADWVCRLFDDSDSNG